VSFDAITHCVASQRVSIVVNLLLFISSSTQSGNFWIHPRLLDLFSKIFGYTKATSSM
jgi:hypothetical protein